MMETEGTRVLVHTGERRYRLSLPPIYEGNLSTVYKAWDMALNRWAAVKEVPLRGLSPKDVKAMESEVTVACQLGERCEHVPQVFDRFRQRSGPEEYLYLVTQWIEGVSLRSLMRGEPLSDEEKLDLACQLCELTAQLHRERRQHRDLRPENLQVVRRGGRRQLWLLDFNLTAAVPRIGRGTAGYLAPEQSGISSQAGAERVDVFAIGVILYELFTGIIPMYGYHYLEDRGSGAWAKFIPPSGSGMGSVPEGLDPIVTKCMQLDWRQRYRDAGQIARDLRRLRRPGRPKTSN